MLFVFLLFFNNLRKSPPLKVDSTLGINFSIQSAIHLKNKKGKGSDYHA